MKYLRYLTCECGKFAEIIFDIQSLPHTFVRIRFPEINLKDTEGLSGKMDHLTLPMRHLAVLRETLTSFHAEASLSPFDFRLYVRRGNVKKVLVPKFVFRHAGKLAYTEQFRDGDSVFVGWMPYGVKRWNLSDDKLIFKQFAQSHGLRVPDLVDIAAIGGDYVVKKRRGSFGEEMDGPFRRDEYPDSGLSGNETLYIERYISGKSTKAWYWAGEPIALEMIDRPFVIGDGRRTILQILKQPRGSFDYSYSLSKNSRMLAWQRVDEKTVLEKGRRVFLDFRHVSDFDRYGKSDRNVWSKIEARLQQSFIEAGRVCAARISEIDNPNRLFTIDAVVDDEGRAWFLEMNSNPMVHPNAYRPMLSCLFSGAEAGNSVVGSDRTLPVTQ